MNPQRNLCGPCRRVFLMLVLTPLALMLQPATAPAEDQNGGAPGAWLSSYTGARTLGLGGAFVATADEPLGVVWNPAGLSRLDQNEARFETAHLFEGTALNSLSFAVPGSRLPSFGVSMIHLSSGDFERTNELNDRSAPSAPVTPLSSSPPPELHAPAVDRQRRWCGRIEYWAVAWASISAPSTR